MATTSHNGKPYLGKSVEDAYSCNDNTNDDSEESSIGLEKDTKRGIEPVTNDSEDTDDNNKEVINFGLEPLTNDSDGID